MSKRKKNELEANENTPDPIGESLRQHHENLLIEQRLIQKQSEDNRNNRDKKTKQAFDPVQLEFIVFFFDFRIGAKPQITAQMK